MDPVIFGALAIAYLILIVVLGIHGRRRTRGAEDFLVGGRRMHPIVLALSYGATFISISAIIGFGGVAGELGMGLVWLVVLNIGLGVLISFVVFGKRVREVGSRLGAVTFPDLMGKCYDSPMMQTASGFIILVGMPLYSAAILIGGAHFISTALGLPFDLSLLGFALVVAVYVILGGLVTVMHTEAVQGAIMFVGMIVLLVLTYSMLGGVGPANADLTSMVDMVPKDLWEAGHRGWTAMPELGSPIWLTLITTLTLGVGIGALAQPQLVVRFMTVRDNRSLNRAVAVGGIFILLLTGGAYTLGALTNVYFMQEQGEIATKAVGGNIDSIIPMFINSSMPDAFVVVFMLALLAAAMSTLSSLFHTMGTSAGYDMWRNLKDSKISVLWKGRAGRVLDRLPLPGQDSFTGIQVGILLMIIVSVAVAFLLPGSIIARATAMFFGLCGSALLPVYAHALYSKRPSAKAAQASLAVGKVTWLSWTTFVHLHESSSLGISHFLFGQEAVLGSHMQVVDPLIVALPCSTAALLVVWYLEKRGILFKGPGV
ncbi:MAG: sodium:solute symporter [Methanomassiliicoccales archaeon]